MKILLIGPGSVGRRHLRNIIHLGYEEISVVSRAGNSLTDFPSLPVYPTLEQALLASTYDAAIICTPTSLHTDSLIAVLQAKVPHIYLEKPVSHSLERADEILELANQSGSRIVVGFDLHFDPGMQKVKQLITGNAIGKIVSVNAQVGQYLPDWRPHEDYTKGMSARVETGGGVMLDLIHEFDYLLWLLGSVEKVASLHKNSGALDIETEDVCEVLLQFENGVVGTIHLDYLQQKLVRNCMITGYEGSIFWNLAESNVRWINKEKKEEVFNYSSFERNDRFIEIMRSFLENNGDERLTDLHKGYESLSLVLAAKQSSVEEAFVSVPSLHLTEATK